MASFLIWRAPLAPAAVERFGGLKAFVGKPVGRATLVVVAILTLTGSFLYLGPILAIPTFLLFGLALPIYLGWKVPRQLAIVGIVVLVAAAPVASLLETQMLRQPSPSASSDSVLPYGEGGSVLSAAHVDPFTGAAGGSYTFSVTVNSQYVPRGLTLAWVTLFVSTCAGATGNASPTCPSGYPFFAQNHSWPNSTSGPTVLTFSQTLPGANLWWWQVGAAARNTTSNASLTWIFLDPANGYGAVQGPVSGDYASTLGLALPAVFVTMLFYPGLVFFIALLVYVFFKRREQRRKMAAQAATLPTGAPPATPSAPETPPAAGERSCPNCKAVVYPNEAACWKCGAPLGGAPSGTPLPSGPK